MSRSSLYYARRENLPVLFISSVQSFNYRHVPDYYTTSVHVQSLFRRYEYFTDFSFLYNTDFLVCDFSGPYFASLYLLSTASFPPAMPFPNPINN